MYRELVPFDGRRFFKIDQVALCRNAKQLLDLVPKQPPDDPYEIESKLIPALKASIEGEVDMPFMDESEFISGRYIRERREGILPKIFGPSFQAAYSKFSVTVRSLPLDPPEVEFVNGKQCAWMELEERGDWPRNVKYP